MLRESAEGNSYVHCVCVCVCVCVWGAKDQKEFGISVRKEKVKRLRGVCQHQ